MKAKPQVQSSVPAQVIKVTVSKAQRAGMLGKKVCLRGRITEYTGVTSVPAVNGDLTDRRTLTLQGIDGASNIEVRLNGEKLIDRWESVATSAPTFEIEGTVCRTEPDEKTGERHYFVTATAVRPCDSAFSILDAQDGEIAKACETLKGLAAAGKSALDYIRDELTALIGIVGLDKYAALSEAIDVIIMQAVSDGTIENASGRIHSFVIGRPASGKKLLSVAAGVLNPAHEEVGKSLSKAGLVGFPQLGTGGKFRHTPGALPKAHRGVVTAEDYHEFPTAARREFQIHTSNVMESGFVVDSKMGNRKYTALTAIHIDSNLPSQVKLDRPDPIADTRVLPPQNLLSRIDYVAVMPDVSDINTEVGRELVKRLAGSKTARASGNSARDRALKVLVAQLKKHYQTARIPTGNAAGRDFTGLYEELVSDAKGADAQAGGWINNYATRMAFHMARLATSHAVLHSRQVANLDDIDKVRQLKTTTLAALRRFVAPGTAAKTKEEDLAWAHFSDRSSIAPRDVSQWLKDSGLDTTGTSESLRNKSNRILERLRRDGKATKEGHQQYTVLPCPFKPVAEAADEPEEPVMLGYSTGGEEDIVIVKRTGGAGGLVWAAGGPRQYAEEFLSKFDQQRQHQTR